MAIWNQLLYQVNRCKIQKAGCNQPLFCVYLNTIDLVLFIAQPSLPSSVAML